MEESSRKEQSQRQQGFVWWGEELGVPGLLGPSPNPSPSRSPTPQQRIKAPKLLVEQEPPRGGHYSTGLSFWVTQAGLGQRGSQKQRNEVSVHHTNKEGRQIFHCAAAIPTEVFCVHKPVNQHSLRSQGLGRLCRKLRWLGTLFFSLSRSRSIDQ